MNAELEEIFNDYPILKHKDFTMARLSIESLDGKDDLNDDRAFLTDRLNEWSDNENGAFYWEMLRCLKFVLEGATAYTTRDKVISLNYPCTDIIPQDADRYRKWYFVYSHECLHQLWDTFGVGKEIEAAEGSCNFPMLNVASDCVINDYLSTFDKANKLPPENGIFPQVLKDQYGVDYDRRTDTQYTLYMKLKNLPPEQQKKLQKLLDETEQQQQHGGGQGQGQGQGNGKGQGQSQGQGNDKAQGQGQGQKGQGQNGQNQQGQGQGQTQGDQDGTGKQAGTGEGDINSRQLLDEIRRHAESVCKKYSNSIVGPLKEFTKKCQDSRKLKKADLLANAAHGSMSWNKELLLECKLFLKKKLHTNKLFRSTYNKVRRGERAFTTQDMKNRRVIIQGREEVKNKTGFDVALYIDVSGSMSDCIDHVFKAAYSICDELKRTFGKDPIVDKDKINLKAFVFTTVMREIKYGQKCSANGGTYDFDALLSDIHKREANAFLNIVITDGEFGSIKEQEVADTIADMEGMFILVTNNDAGKFEGAERAVKSKCGPRFKAIQADKDFTVK